MSSVNFSFSFARAILGVFRLSKLYHRTGKIVFLLKHSKGLGLCMFVMCSGNKDGFDVFDLFHFVSTNHFIKCINRSQTVSFSMLTLNR